MLRRKRDGHDRQANEEGVTKVQGRHGSVLVAEFILRPDAAFALGAVYGVDEAVAAGFVADGAGHVGVREETGRHAGPEGEDDEGDEVAHGHCASACGVEGCAGGAAVCFALGFVVER